MWYFYYCMALQNHRLRNGETWRAFRNRQRFNANHSTELFNSQFSSLNTYLNGYQFKRRDFQVKLFFLSCIKLIKFIELNCWNVNVHAITGRWCPLVLFFRFNCVVFWTSTIIIYWSTSWLVSCNFWFPICIRFTRCLDWKYPQLWHNFPRHKPTNHLFLNLIYRFNHAYFNLFSCKHQIKLHRKGIFFVPGFSYLVQYFVR